MSSRLCGGRPLRLAGWALVVLAVVWPSMAEAQTPAGTRIESAATVSFETAAGTRLRGTSNRVVLVVAQLAGADLAPPRHAVVRPGEEAVFAHVLRNVGNGADTFTVEAESSRGWPRRLFVDLNGDGAPGANEERPWNAALPVAMADSLPILITVSVPRTRAVQGASDTLRVAATSRFSAGAADLVLDRVDVQDAGVFVTLDNAVDLGTATPGSVLTYTVRFAVAGSAHGSSLVLVDSVPAGTELLPGTIRVDGEPRTDAPGDDEAWQDAGAVVMLALDSIFPGLEGELSFQVRLRDRIAPVSTARATYETRLGRDSVESNTVRSRLVFPDLALEKSLVSAPVAADGDTVIYSLSYNNRSDSSPAHGVVLVDSLPEGLDYVAASPEPRVSGRELRWDLGTVAAGGSGQVELMTTIRHEGFAPLTVRNVAMLHSESLADTARILASAAAVAVDNALTSGLSVSKSADALEAAVGDVVPYTVAVENTGEQVLDTIRIVDLLPPGTRFVEGSAAGPDSVIAGSDTLTFIFHGSIAPGERVMVRYTLAVVSADGASLRNVAYATAVEGRVRSQDALSMVRVRRTHAMATRVAIGKVWVDGDGDGVQDPGEAGVAGVDIWSDGGEVVTTDADGRFSIRNLDPGNRSFRLDPTTLPLAYGLEAGAGSDLEIRDASGWSTPRVNFRVVPREARVAGVALPLDVSFQARPLRDEAELTARYGVSFEPLPDSLCAMEDPSGPLRMDDVQFELDRDVLTPAAREVLDRAAGVFAEYPALRAEVAGHTDATGSRAYNLDLSGRRAASVISYLSSRGIEPARLSSRGYGPDRPVATNETAEGRARNRRVELVLDETSRAELLAAREVARALACAPPEPPTIAEYRLDIRNPYDAPVAGLLYQPDRGFDSLQVRVNGSVVAHAWDPAARRFELPSLPARSELVVLGWLSEHPDSASAALAQVGAGGTTPEQLTLRAEVHNPLRPVSARPPFAAMAALPAPDELPEGGEALLMLDARHVGVDSATFSVPEGWALTDDASGYRPVRDRDGSAAVAFATAGGILSLPLRPVAVDEAVDSVRVPALLTAEERAAEQRRAIVAGPGVAFFHPGDGVVLSSDRVFIGVKGEPGAEVTVFAGDTILGEATLRPDGVADFVAVKLPAGPQRLRVRMRNSWQQERWDSLAVHVSGEPAAFAFESQRTTLVADGQTLAPVRVRVLDRWGVPVTYGPTITVEAQGARPVATDADPSSVGLQVRADPAGAMRFDLRPGHDVGAGELNVRIGDARGRLPLEVLAPTRPLMVTAVGRTGLGASPESYGAVTIRGRLDERTDLLLRYDSRQQADAFETFGRSADPLDPAQYPLLGDAGERRLEGATRGAFSARLRRGLDWVGVGDLTTMDFTEDLALTTYHRAITGAAARVETGPAVWRAFASATRQAVVNDRIRGQGISGPYQLAGALLPGTERVSLETRALENPDRVIASQAMARYVDYQVDHESGVILFKRPVPAVDAHGNPVFIAVSFEARDAGEARPVWGIRGTARASELLGLEEHEVEVGGTLIRDEGQAGVFQLTGANLRLADARGSELRAEVSHAESPDSSGTAVSLDGSIIPLEGLTLEARWRSVGEGYHNPSSGRYRGGSRELMLGATYDVGGATLSLSHDRQAFSGFESERERTRAGVTYPFSSEVTVEAGLLDETFGGPTDLRGQPAGEAKVTWTPSEDLTAWVDGRQHIGAAVGQPDFAGVGAEYAVTEAFRLSARHRQVSVLGPEGDEAYGVTDVGVRSSLWGGELWTGYQLAGVDGARSAALVGLNNRVSLGRGWTLGGSFERRVGVAAADPTDPIRAMPFLQQEEDYWASTLSIEHVPGDAPYRVSGRGEYRDGDTRSTRMLELAGELSLSQGFALLSRQELMRVETAVGAEMDVSRRTSSLWGVAFRPVASDRLNVLAKLEWLDAENPIGGGVLTSRGDERRLIGAAEAIWEPARDAEVAVRFASRRSEASQLLEDGSERVLTSSARFIGWRASSALVGRFGARVEGRMLMEQNTGAVLSDIAPQLTFAPLAALELAAGYRFGDLRDPDFAVSGGAGAFLTVGARVTERTLGTAADFWRSRVGQ